jgi:hypothetical protein
MVVAVCACPGTMVGRILGTVRRDFRESMLGELGGRSDWRRDVLDVWEMAAGMEYTGSGGDEYDGCGFYLFAQFRKPDPFAVPADDRPGQAVARWYSRN